MLYNTHPTCAQEIDLLSVNNQPVHREGGFDGQFTDLAAEDVGDSNDGILNSDFLLLSLC